MKKLMFVAALAAASTALATTQVYEMRINLKATECKSTTLRAGQNPFVAVAAGATQTIQYRDLSTLTLQGLIWACNCDYIQDLGQTQFGTGTLPAVQNWKWYRWAIDGTAATYAPVVAQTSAEGYVFWNAKTREPWGYATINKPAATVNNPATWTPTATTPANRQPMPTFYWDILQRIGARADKVEGVWRLEDWYSGANGGLGLYALTGAGFGTARAGTVDTTANLLGRGAAAGSAVGLLNECDEALITSMSGNVAGFAMVTAGASNCVFCGSDPNCAPWPFCNCDAAPKMMVDNPTAVYGTWTLKYNATLSRRLLSQASIRDCYTFSTATADVIRMLEANAL